VGVGAGGVEGVCGGRLITLETCAPSIAGRKAWPAGWDEVSQLGCEAPPGVGNQEVIQDFEGL
jgi:hypothetical protein